MHICEYCQRNASQSNSFICEDCDVTHKECFIKREELVEEKTMPALNALKQELDSLEKTRMVFKATVEGDNLSQQIVSMLCSDITELDEVIAGVEEEISALTQAGVSE